MITKPQCAVHHHEAVVQRNELFALTMATTFNFSSDSDPSSWTTAYRGPGSLRQDSPLPPAEQMLNGPIELCWHVENSLLEYEGLFKSHRQRSEGETCH